MSEDEFTKLFKYIESFRTEVVAKLDEKASQSSLNSLIITIDGFVKRIDDSEIEASSKDAQFAKLVEWAREVSKVTGIPLPNL